MSRKLDTATLTALDCACGGRAIGDVRRRRKPDPMAGHGPVIRNPKTLAMLKRDPKNVGDKSFSDPGSEHGPSILCPDIYEALKRKGYSKEKAARISNAKCNE